MYEKSCASSNHIKSWKDIDFGTAEYEVKKLQMRIAKAVKENRVGKLNATDQGTPQGGLCRARHNPPYDEIDVMPRYIRYS